MISVRPWLAPMMVLGLLGCSTVAPIDNRSSVELSADTGYGIRHYQPPPMARNRVTLVLAFSGGGGRAAALSYGVMQALQQYTLSDRDGQPYALLDEVDVITSVSGGSFTAAYYGLFGKRLFDDFEDDFLRQDYQSAWLRGLMNPLQWFSSGGRSEVASALYQERLFQQATFADLQRQGGPLTVLNATDLGGGLRFSFLQEYFDLLCSDLNSFPIARAVTASAAVPIMLNPVVLRNHAGCSNPTQSYVQQISTELQQALTQSPGMMDTVSGLNRYQDKLNRRYIHLVDGGITDNLGLMAMYEMVELGGGIERWVERLGNRHPEALVVISVNASTKPGYAMEHSNTVPTLDITINAVTDTQLHRYNNATIDLLQRSVTRWSGELSSFWQPVTGYFIELNFDGVESAVQRDFLNQIPTGLALNDAQVDALITTGQQLLAVHPDFQRLLRQLRDGSAQ